MWCFPSTKHWEVYAKVGQNDKCYSIRLQKPFGWKSTFDLYVNKTVVSSNLPLKNSSPFYQINGQFIWEQDNNIFVIARDSLIFTAFSKKYRLFVNRFETETGLEFAEFWKRRGWQHVFVGICMLTLCVGIALMVNYVDQKSLFLAFDIIIGALALLLISFGVFLIFFKHETTRNVYQVGQSIENGGFENSAGKDQDAGIDVEDVTFSKTVASSSSC